MHDLRGATAQRLSTLSIELRDGSKVEHRTREFGAAGGLLVLRDEAQKSGENVMYPMDFVKSVRTTLAED